MEYFWISTCNYNTADVVQLVLKKCTTTNAKDGGSISPDNKDYAVTFNYEFIEDSKEVQT